MIELNLLPDIKLEYIKAQRARRLVLSIAVLVSAGSIALLLLLLSVDGLQQKHLNDVNNDIKKYSGQLNNKPHINQILTVQNQLASLTALHAGKPDAGRLFSYLGEVTPPSVDINNFTIDFTLFTATMTGDADSLSSVNQYVDNLKATTYTSSNSTQALPAFSNVVLSSFGLTSAADPGSSQTNKPASYAISLSYDKNIFDITQKINLTVPNTTANRATDLFVPVPANSTGGSH